MPHRTQPVIVVGSEGEPIAALTELREHSNSPSRTFTTKEMQSYERETIQRMREGQHQFPEIAGQRSRDSIERDYPHLNERKRQAVSQILASRDRVMALEGVAGSGKTTSLTAIREAAERRLKDLRAVGVDQVEKGAQLWLKERRLKGYTKDHKNVVYRFASVSKPARA